MPLPANVRLLIDLAAVLKERRLRWYVFGAQAASYCGRPRMTEDVDVTVRVPRGKLRALIEALAKAKSSRASPSSRRWGGGWASR